MEKIKFTAPNGVEVEGTVLNSVYYELVNMTVVVRTVYAQNRIAEIRTKHDYWNNTEKTSVKTLVEYCTIPELD